jgi:Inner membrane component of T3SS, cytoplasmic domain
MSEPESAPVTDDIATAEAFRLETAPPEILDAPDEENTAITASPAPYDSPENGVLFFVISGLHEGASFKMPENGATIGSSYDCDLILSDDRVEETHLRIIGKETTFGYVASVTCEGSDVLINGKITLEQGQTRDFSANFVITLGGDVSLRVLITRVQPIESAYRKYVAPKITDLQTHKKTLQGRFNKATLIDDKRNLALSIVSGLFLLVIGFNIFLAGEPEKPPLHSGGGAMAVAPSNSSNLAEYRKSLLLAEKDLRETLIGKNIR